MIELSFFERVCGELERRANSPATDVGPWLRLLARADLDCLVVDEAIERRKAALFNFLRNLPGTSPQLRSVVLDPENIASLEFFGLRKELSERADPDNGIPDSDTGPGECPPGFMRALVRPNHGGEYSIEEIFVGTTQANSSDQPLPVTLRQLSTSVVPVDDVLRTLVYPQIRLRHQNAPLALRSLVLPFGYPVGDTESGIGGRSMDLALCLAAISDALGLAWRHSRVVATGELWIEPRIDLHGVPMTRARVNAVGEISKKLAACCRLARTFEQGPGLAVILPEVQTDPRLWQKSVRDEVAQLQRLERLTVYGAANLEEAVRCMPIVNVPKEPKLSGGDFALLVAFFILFAERIPFGEYMTDVYYRMARPNIVTQLIIPTSVAALVPTLALLVSTHAVRRSRRFGRAMVLGSFAIVGAALASFALQWAFGLLDFVPRIYTHPHGQDVIRRAINFKDTAFFIPVIWVIFIFVPIEVAYAARYVNRTHSLRGILDRSWLDRQQKLRSISGWLILVQFLAGALGIFALTMLFIGDLRWCLDPLRNGWLAGHIFFQIAGVGLICVLAAGRGLALFVMAD